MVVHLNKQENKLSIIIDLIGKRKGFLYIKLPENKTITSYNFNFSKVDSTNNIWELYVEMEDNVLLEIGLT